MATPPTILALKQAFLERETRRLAQPLAPSRSWRLANGRRRGRSDGAGDDATSRPIPEKAVDDALFRANQLLRQHARRVYAPQAVRHVAEQLDQLYWHASERAVDGAAGAGVDGDKAGDMLDLGADYTLPEVLAGLPPQWERAEEAEALPLEARRYAELVVQLQALAARKTAAAARVRRLQRLAALLAPFAGDGADAADDSQSHKRARIQDNVVTRDGPVERELERMRVLLARVGDGVAALQCEGSAGSKRAAAAAGLEDSVEAAGQKRVRALLERF